MDWGRVKTILHEATARPAAERQEYVKEACAGDAALLAEVLSLLEAGDGATRLLAAPSMSDGVAETRLGPVAEQPGDLIGRYKLLEQIGEGGFGVVFMGEQQRPVRRRVALKVLKPGMDTAQVLARFEAERQALALMDHPNIAKVFDAGATETGRPYFAMELVRGDPITNYCDRNSMTTAERLALFRQVCSAVQHAHNKGLIHRDIKPTNVLVATTDGKPIPKVIDFGVAKAVNQRLTERTLFTQHRQIIGTPEYMSPEQADTTPMVDVDTRSDIYSLGVLLYELLTGVTPFPAARLREAGLGEMLRIIRETDPPRPSTRLSTLGVELPEVAKRRGEQPGKLGTLVRGDLDWIVMKALEKERGRRYTTADAFVQDIDRHLKDEPVEASPPTTAYRIRKYVRRHRAGVTAAVLVLIALVFGVIGTSSGMVWATAERGVAERARDKAELSERQARLAAFQTTLLAASQAMRDAKPVSAGRLLDLIRAEDRNHWWDVARATTTTADELLPNVNRGGWSPGGRWVLAQSQDDLRILDGVTFDTLASMSRDTDGGRVWASQWHDPDSLVIQVHNAEDDDFRLRLLGVPELRPLGPPITGDLRRVSLRSWGLIGDDEILAALMDDGDALLRVINVRTGELLHERRVPDAAGLIERLQIPSGRPQWVGLSALDGGPMLAVAVPSLDRHTIIDRATPRGQARVSGTGSLLVRRDGPTAEAWSMSLDGEPTLVWERTFESSVVQVQLFGDQIAVQSSTWLHLLEYASGASVAQRIPGPYHSSSINADGSKLMLISRPTRVLRLADYRLPHAVRVAQTAPVAFAFSDDEQLAAVTTWDGFFEQQAGSLKVIDTATCSVLAEMLGQHEYAKSVAISPCGRYLAANTAVSPIGRSADSAREPNTIYVWSLRSGRVLWQRSERDLRRQNQPVAFSADGETLFVGQEVMRTIDGVTLRNASHPERGPASITSDRRRLLISDFPPYNQWIVDRQTGERLAIDALDALEEWRARSLSPDGRRALLSPERGPAVIVDLETGQRAATMPEQSGRLLASAWSPDGQTIATGGRDGFIRLWDASTFEVRGVFFADDEYIRGVRFLDDGQTLASIGGDGTFRLWNTRTPREQAEFVNQRRTIADELRPWVDELAESSERADAQDAWAALDAADLDDMQRQIAGRLLIGALLQLHAQP